VKAEKRRIRSVTRRQERRFLEMASEAVRSDFPNPERLGCPGSVALEAIARHHVSFSEAEDVVDHIATCAPCFVEYTGYRRRYRVRVVGTMLLACVAGLVAIAFLWRFVPRHRSVQERIVAHDTDNSIPKATLDFRDKTVQRSGRPQPTNSTDIPHLRRALLNIAIKLPMGMEDGRYAVELRTDRNQAAVDAKGIAAWDGSAETLNVTIDLRHLKSGQYRLDVRHDGSSWHEYLVVVD
jgi:hypothetical protein